MPGPDIGHEANNPRGEALKIPQWIRQRLSNRRAPCEMQDGVKAAPAKEAIIVDFVARGLSEALPELRLVRFPETNAENGVAVCSRRSRQPPAEKSRASGDQDVHLRPGKEMME